MGYILHDDNTFTKDGHKTNKKRNKKKYKRLQKMKKNSKRKNRRWLLDNQIRTQWRYYLYTLWKWAGVSKRMS